MYDKVYYELIYNDAYNERRKRIQKQKIETMEEVAEKVQIPVTERTAIPHQTHKAIMLAIRTHQRMTMTTRSTPETIHKPVILLY